MSLILDAAAVSDLGLVRGNNEDSAFAGRRLVAVADGIGGMPAGELASEIAIRTLAPLEEEPDVIDPVSRLRAAAEAANRKIREATESNPATDGMGTTITALLLADVPSDHRGAGTIGLLHVGDSRCYLGRDGAMSQITKDDTFVQALVDQGVLSAEDARHHPRRSLVMQAVVGQDLSTTCDVLAARPGDRYLLCSDGLSDVVIDDSIARVLLSDLDPRTCGDRLVRLALDAGAPDNVTVIVADVVERAG
jgi:protein phosphatase